MEIVANDIQGLDLFVLLKLTEKQEESKVNVIKNELGKWCDNAIEGAYGGNMHYIHSLKYNAERNFVYAFIDMGTMDPEMGINTLAEICDNINAEFGSELIGQIELNGSDEILELLEPST